MNRYQSYKPSGVEWIGDIPDIWRISKFKYVSKLYTGNSLNDEQKVLYESENENHIPYVSSKDIDLNSQTVNYDNGLRIPKDNNPFKISPKDSFLLCVEGGSSGRKMVYLDRDVCFVNKLCSFKSIENTRFQYYFIQSSNFQDKFKLSLSGLIGGVSISTLRDFKLVLPPIQEQLQIVKFLNEKTELIDKLISTKERKITLLKEQRTSLINQVVTKGLNPNVKMKDSGVEWIGEIPEKWKVSPIKYTLQKNRDSIRTGPFGSSLKSDEFLDEGVRVYNQRSVYDEDFSKSDIFISEEKFLELKGFIVLPGDILITSRGTIGRMTIVPEDGEIGVLHPCLIRLRLNQEILIPSYLWWYINQSSLFITSVKIESNSTTIEVIYSETLSTIRIPIPGIKEQMEIIDFLNLRVKEIDDLVSMEQKKIDLLKEYRQSLISEVVTGKIKVTTDE